MSPLECQAELAKIRELNARPDRAEGALRRFLFLLAFLTLLSGCASPCWSISDFDSATLLRRTDGYAEFSSMRFQSPAEAMAFAREHRLPVCGFPVGGAQ